MTTKSPPRIASITSRTLLGLTVAAVTALGAALSTNPDGLIERSFTLALARHHQAAPAEKGAAGPVVAGTEAFWLGGDLPQGAAAVAWGAGVGIGDQITLGNGQVLEVVGLSELPARSLGLAEHGVSDQLLLVTCRDTIRPDAPVVRVILDTASWSQPRNPVNPAAL